MGLKAQQLCFSDGETCFNVHVNSCFMTYHFIPHPHSLSYIICDVWGKRLNPVLSYIMGYIMVQYTVFCVFFSRMTT